MIRKVGTRFVIFSEAGKRLGEYTSREAAERRLREIEAFKHMKGRK